MSELVQQMTANYRKHAPDLKAFLQRLGCPVHTAEDIVQESFFRAIKYQTMLRRITHMRAWLYKTAYHLFIDLRRRDREKLTDQDQAAGEASSPMEAAIAREEGDMAKRALAMVPERQRIAILLCDVSCLSYEEAADVLHVTASTIRGLLFRGRIRLREEYGILEKEGGHHKG